MQYLYHIAKKQDWVNAQKVGIYAVGSLHRNFEEDGFIHLSYAYQANVVADMIYHDTPELVLLVIDPAKLTAKVVDERADPSQGLFPHLYGPLNVDAVIDVRQYEPSDDGRFPVVEAK